MAHKCSYWSIFVFTREYVTWLRWLNFRRKSSLKRLLLKKSSQINGINKSLESSVQPFLLCSPSIVVIHCYKLAYQVPSITAIWFTIKWLLSGMCKVTNQ